MGVADENNTAILEMYTDYVTVTESAPEVVVDKAETHFGFRVEDMQTILPELVYSDNNGVARDIKWNNITTLLVKENQQLHVTIADLVARVEALEQP
ncbi:hypothetical protein SARC_04374 [Sphaeroforma arctica JP610]|uniref:Peptidase S74 domain-containing protein n=1 Tax=Sphaeroforma arctica JP610 TaxID=667725 RepID=A0A0L0G3E8_9EUKA|nr:hypothetical protein SARC_04374 [Sphaeroforma arctica JP610]KNC83366.1 hypothetical protein SARC_04374 [Sphaeroforma arctica JP610]|eukprot:XP_014157268.1 hypothetical protein SARC_04374 [Sphaeroforma arctica JP610]